MLYFKSYQTNKYPFSLPKLSASCQLTSSSTHQKICDDYASNSPVCKTVATPFIFPFFSSRQVRSDHFRFHRADGQNVVASEQGKSFKGHAIKSSVASEVESLPFVNLWRSLGSFSTHEWLMSSRTLHGWRAVDWTKSMC